MKTIVAVIGAGTCTAEEAALAEAVGRGLAERGAILVCGGRGGVMEAACRGAKAAGGLTVGILPGRTPAEANPYVDVPLATGLGEARNVLVVRAAQAVIAIGGEFGTLSEIGFALKLGIPVIGLNTWGLTKGGAPVQAIRVARTPGEAVAWAVGEKHHSER
jgi:uncharacterized protein (TIGR00725 family)